MTALISTCFVYLVYDWQRGIQSNLNAGGHALGNASLNWIYSEFTHVYFQSQWAIQHSPFHGTWYQSMSTDLRSYYIHSIQIYTHWYNIHFHKQDALLQRIQNSKSGPYSPCIVQRFWIVNEKWETLYIICTTLIYNQNRQDTTLQGLQRDPPLIFQNTHFEVIAWSWTWAWRKDLCPENQLGSKPFSFSAPFSLRSANLDCKEVCRKYQILRDIAVTQDTGADIQNKRDWPHSIILKLEGCPWLNSEMIHDSWFQDHELYTKSSFWNHELYQSLTKHQVIHRISAFVWVIKLFKSQCFCAFGPLKKWCSISDQDEAYHT